MSRKDRDSWYGHLFKDIDEIHTQLLLSQATPCNGSVFVEPSKVLCHYILRHNEAHINIKQCLLGEPLISKT